MHKECGTSVSLRDRVQGLGGSGKACWRRCHLTRDLPMSNFHSSQQELFVRTPFPSFWITGNGNSRPDRNATGEGGLIWLLCSLNPTSPLIRLVLTLNSIPTLGPQLWSRPSFKPNLNLILTLSPDPKCQYRQLSQQHQWTRTQPQLSLMWPRYQTWP